MAMNLCVFNGYDMITNHYISEIIVSQQAKVLLIKEPFQLLPSISLTIKF